MATVSHAPHIRSVEAGNKYYDPLHGAIYEVIFSIPTALNAEFNGKDVAILTEQVTNVSGIDALQKTVAAGEQYFLGATVSYLNPTHDTTAADITIEFNLNLRNVTDNYVLRLFKAWSTLGYDLATGHRRLMKDYIAPFMTINEANRDGTIWRSSKFQKVMLTSVTGLDALDYKDNEARKLTVVFRSDIWNEQIEKGIANA
jgi:hypothetical protein